MAGIQTFAPKTSVETLYNEYFFTLGRLRRHKLAKALAPMLEALRPKLDAAAAEELGLTENEYEAAAAVVYADNDLNDSVDFVSGNAHRNTPLWTRLFADQRPSDLKKPLLGGQLETMRSWPATLTSVEGNAILKDHAPILTERVTAGDAAAAEKKTVAQNFADYRAVGTRARLITELNAARKAIHGKLGEIQHANHLRAGWAESFFMQDSSPAPTLGELDRRIAAMEAQLTSLKKQREEQAAQEEEDARNKQEAERQGMLHELDGIEKAKQDLAEKEAQLRARLEQDKPKDPPEGTPPDT